MDWDTRAKLLIPGTRARLVAEPCRHGTYGGTQYRPHPTERRGLQIGDEVTITREVISPDNEVAYECDGCGSVMLHISCLEPIMDQSPSKEQLLVGGARVKIVAPPFRYTTINGELKKLENRPHPIQIRNLEIGDEVVLLVELDSGGDVGYEVFRNGATDGIYYLHKSCVEPINKKVNVQSHRNDLVRGSRVRVIKTPCRSPKHQHKLDRVRLHPTEKRNLQIGDEITIDNVGDDNEVIYKGHDYSYFHLDISCVELITNLSQSPSKCEDMSLESRRKALVEGSRARVVKPPCRKYETARVPTAKQEHVLEQRDLQIGDKVTLLGGPNLNDEVMYEGYNGRIFHLHISCLEPITEEPQSTPKTDAPSSPAFVAGSKVRAISPQDQPQCAVGAILAQDYERQRIHPVYPIMKDSPYRLSNDPVMFAIPLVSVLLAASVLTVIWAPNSFRFSIQEYLPMSLLDEPMVHNSIAVLIAAVSGLLITNGSWLTLRHIAHGFAKWGDRNRRLRKEQEERIVRMVLESQKKNA